MSMFTRLLAKFRKIDVIKARARAAGIAAFVLDWGNRIEKLDRSDLRRLQGADQAVMIWELAVAAERMLPGAGQGKSKLELVRKLAQESLDMADKAFDDAWALLRPALEAAIHSANLKATKWV